MSNRIYIIIIIVFIAGMFTYVQWGNKMEKKAHELIYFTSNYGAAETVKRAKDVLNEMQVPLFAEFDHAKNAQEAGLTLRPTTVLVFGSPKAGTLLMQQNQAVAIELPLKILIWEDGAGAVKIAYTNPKVIAGHYDLEGNPVIEKMVFMLEQIALKSGGLEQPAI